MISNMHHAKTHLSQLVEKALQGEDVVLAKDGTPLVRLTPIRDTFTARKFGALQGKVWISPDCWEDDSETWGQMENTPLFPENP